MTDQSGKENQAPDQQQLPDKRKGVEGMRNPQVDWGKLTVEALNRHTSSPEFEAKYMRWLEAIGPNCWTPVAKADYEAMKAKGVKPAAADD